MANKRPLSAPVGASLIVLSSFFYASYGIWTKLMGDFFQGYTASALRSVLVLLILLPIALFYRHLQPLKLKQNWRYIAGMLIASLFTWGPLYYAILHAGVGISLAIVYASIVIGSFFFGWLFGRERFTKDKAISAGLGVIGLGLIFSPSTGSLGWLALLGALVSGLSAGANAVFSKQIRYNATQSTIVLWVTSVIANFVMAFALQEHYPEVGWYAPWLWLVFFAVASVIASWSLVKGVKLIDAGAAGVLGLLEIVFGVIFGVIFFHERPAAIALLGMAVIIGAASIPYFKDYNAKRGTLDE
ncbi:EamA family transporter [Candidatus Saccharibacteria bacterium]|nr:MAG: EamA family transporter [Candidatus Saccharibacteria bacterium]